MVKRDVKIVPRPCKLINTRNNCFFNSAIQLTLFVHPLTTFFSSAKFHKKQRICQSFQNFINLYSENRVLDPQIFINQLSSKIDIFNGEEQDAQEFLVLFYGILVEELGFLKNMEISNKSEFIQISKSNIMIDSFYGIIKNRIEYIKCSHQSVLTHQFCNLTLHVTDSIQESLDKYLETDLNRSETKCDQCGKISKVRVKREFLLSPKILNIHLSRFHSFRKINDQCIINQRLSVGDYYYHPIGFICHIGTTLDNGHYTAYAKVLSRWYLFDDTSVTETNLDETNKRAAYIIFYSRI